MKLNVLKSFNDKYTGQKYKAGEIIDVSEKRGAEILAHAEVLAEKVFSESSETFESYDEAPKRQYRKRG